MPIQLPLVYLPIAQHKGISAARLCQLTGLSQSAMARNITALTKEGDKAGPGLGLVVKTIDPRNGKAIHLTKDGRTMAARITDVLARAVRVRKAVLVGVAGEVVAPLEKPRNAFAGAHWEVWAD